MRTGLVAALAALVASLSPSLAEARGLHVRVGGRVHVSGGVVVRVGTPPPPPVYYAPSYPVYPSYPQYYAEPAPAIAVAAPVRRRPMFGIGIMASSVAIAHSELQAEGVGLLGRLRLAPRFQLELQLSQDKFVDNPRIDSRAGVAGIFDLGRPGGLTPYLVLGAGVNVIEPLGHNDNVDPESLPVQGYLEAGIGLEWEISRHLALSGDFRMQARRFDPEQHDTTRARPPVGSSFPEKENAAEGRVNLILYF